MIVTKITENTKITGGTDDLSSVRKSRVRLHLIFVYVLPQYDDLFITDPVQLLHQMGL